MVRHRVLYADEFERIGMLPGFGLEVGLATIGELKALITWGQGVPADEVGTAYNADEYVILGEGGQWAERIICSQNGFGVVRARDKTVNFVLKNRPTAPTATAAPAGTGWVACDHSQGDRIDRIKHGELRESFQEAQNDAEQHGYEGVRYVGPEGYLYLEP